MDTQIILVFGIAVVSIILFWRCFRELSKIQQKLTQLQDEFFSNSEKTAHLKQQQAVMENEITEMKEKVEQVSNQAKSLKETDLNIDERIKQAVQSSQLFHLPAKTTQMRTSKMQDVLSRLKNGEDKMEIAQKTGMHLGEIELISGLSRLMD